MMELLITPSGSVATAIDASTTARQYVNPLRLRELYAMSPVPRGYVHDRCSSKAALIRRRADRPQRVGC